MDYVLVDFLWSKTYNYGRSKYRKTKGVTANLG